MAVKLWKNTKTLDGLIDEIPTTESPQDADVALLGSKGIDLDAFPKLRGIFRAGVGRENVPEAAAAARGIQVAFPDRETTEVLFDETASFSCGLILRMLYDDCGTLEPWFKRSRRATSTLRLLVIGTGNIGARVVQKMTSFMQVDTFDLKDDQPQALLEKIAAADCISLHIPGSPDTRGWFGAEAIGAMKDGGILVNAARGPIVDEMALLSAIEAGKIRAAFDVYWQEPYLGRLREFHPERFYMTPHVASTSVTFLEGCARSLERLVSEIDDA
jgi:phosphoglycerate dehydrogenase-like enzyme